MKKGKCKLCLQVKNLCRESHIIPRFMYRHIAGDNNELIFISDKNTIRKFNSEYEKNILCKNCDSEIIGKLENYFSKFIHGELQIPIQSRFGGIDNHYTITIENNPEYKYNLFKLFLLSLLWRASISSRPFFKQIKLPQVIEEDLRDRLLNHQPGEPDLYACFVYLPPITTDQQGRTGFHTFYMPTMSPIYTEDGDLKMCKFVIEGVSYYFIVSRPVNMKVEPAIGKNKLMLALSTVDEQEKLIKLIAEHLGNHKRNL